MAQALSAQNVLSGLRLTVAGSVVGAFSGTLAERLSDMLLRSVGLERGEDISIGEAGVELVLRGTVSSLAFIFADRLMRTVQGNDLDATQGLFFSFLFVQSQPELLIAADRFAKAASSVLPL